MDLRYALRQFRKAPVFTAIAVLTLALGIGANTGVFTLLDQALLRTMPVDHPEQLVRLRFSGLHQGNINYYGGDEYDYFSYPAYRELRDKNTVFSGIIANSVSEVGVQWNNQPELAKAELVSGNYFDVLGVRPAAGRLLIPADDVQNGSRVVALSFSYWQTRFNSDSSVVGKALMINGQPFTIVGVVQPGFHSAITGYAPKLFFPVQLQHVVNPAADYLDDIRSSWLTLEARLKPGETRAHAEAGMQGLWQALRAEQLKQVDSSEELVRRGFVRDTKLLLVDDQRGFSPLREQIRVPLLIVTGMVGLVLLMACVNVSSLLLVRAAGRVREMSVRYSLGATRWQITRQLLIEGLLLGTFGGAVGLALAPIVSSALVQRLSFEVMGSASFSTRADLRILLFNFGLAFVVAVLFSLAPALRFLRPNLVASLKQQSATASGESQRLRRISVGLQIGLSLLLLIGAGLFVQTLRNLRNVDVGFATDHLLSFGIDPPLAGYKPEQVHALHERIIHSLQALPGTLSVAGNTDPELMGMESRTGVIIPGSTHTDPIHVEAPWVTPEYFATTGITMLAGRDFNEHDTVDTPMVVIVNASFARHYFGSAQNAVGRSLEHGNKKGKSDLLIVGVVADSKHVDMRTDVRETLYRAAYQYQAPGFLQFYIRTSQSPDAVKPMIGEAMRQIDANLVVDTLRTMDEQIAESVSNERMIAMLAVSFGVLATLMAAIGLYGILAYSTAQRTREIGIRMALGARRASVVRMVLGDVLRLAGVSIVVTLPLAFALTRLLRSQLYNVSAADPLVTTCGVLLVAGVVLLAAILPARRAARVEPMQALRTE